MLLSNLCTHVAGHLFLGAQLYRGLQKADITGYQLFVGRLKVFETE